MSIEIRMLPQYGISVARDGSIINMRSGKLLTHCPDPLGYKRVYLPAENGKRRSVSVHRALAIAYIPNPEGKPDVNHKDGNVTNNSPDNLEWMTEKENTQHAIRTGLWNPNTSSKMPRNLELISDHESGMPREELMAKYGIKWPGINRILRLYAKRT